MTNQEQLCQDIVDRLHPIFGTGNEDVEYDGSEAVDYLATLYMLLVKGFDYQPTVEGETDNENQS